MSGGGARRPWRVRLGASAVGAAVLTVLLTQAAPFGAADPTARDRNDPSYIVTFEPGTNSAEQQQSRADATDAGGEISHTYTRAVTGFAADLPPAAVADLRNDPDVRSVTPDVPVHASGGVENPAPWNLDRIDQHQTALDNAFRYDGDGTGITVFMLDSGIRADHVEFSGRVTMGFDAIGDGHGTNDCNGHGTHTAGTVGSTTYGVAKGVTLVPVRVLNCAGSGDSSQVVAGLDWVIAHKVTGRSIINMSLGGQANSVIDDAVAAAIAAGIPVVVAAGNDGADACGFSPARAPDAITVGATDSADAKASFSDFGPCVDLFAPGVGIVSAWPTSTTALAVADGTSSAAPHVAGALAVLLQNAPGTSPAALRAALASTLTVGVLTGIGSGSPNALLYAPPHLRLAGVGTATTSAFFAALGTDPAGMAVGGASQVDAFTTSGASTITTQEAATIPNCTITRPTTQAASRTALLASLSANNRCVQFAEAEYPDNSASSPALTYVPYASENVTFATTGVSSIPQNLSMAELQSLYHCTAGAGLRPMLPRAGSGLREFWASLMYGGSVPSNLSCLEDGTDEFGNPIEANTGFQLSNTEIVPYSMPQWQAQSVGILTDTRGISRVGRILGLNPFASNWSVQRNLYVVFAASSVAGTAYTDERLQRAFVGAGSLLCAAVAGPVGQRYGLRTISNCGSA